MSEQAGASRLRVNNTWPPKGRARRTILGVAAATAAAGTIMVLSAAGGSISAGADPASITLCHRTHSNNNPYVVETISPNSINRLIFGKNGHNSHNGPVWDPTLKAQHISWGDIIPPFTWGKHNQFSYEGKNWDATGQAIWANGCAIPAGTSSSAPASTPVSTPVTTPVSTPVTTPVSTPVTTPVSTPVSSGSLGTSAVASHRRTHTPPSHAISATSNGPIPAGVSAGLHTPIANAGLKAWGTVLMVLGGVAGLLAGLWPTRRRAH